MPVRSPAARIIHSQSLPNCKCTLDSDTLSPHPFHPSLPRKFRNLESKFHFVCIDEWNRTTKKMMMMMMIYLISGRIPESFFPVRTSAIQTRSCFEFCSCRCRCCCRCHRLGLVIVDVFVVVVDTSMRTRRRKIQIFFCAKRLSVSC